jgi:short subunit dehydrogenase-like uncharacterized protein
MQDKRYDIVLFGASGFTGQLIAQYLSKNADKEQIQWAIAGRDEKKLIEISASCLDSKPEIITADVKDYQSLLQMTSKAKILMNAVGPFNTYGPDVINACMESKTHYLDITGEPSFVAQTYNVHHQKAQETQVCIVNCCGFDSIPADFAAFLTASKLPANEPKILKGYIRTNATFSGGTLTTAIQALHMEAKKISHKVRLKKNADTPKLPLKIHYNDDIQGWAIPMPVVDPHIVKRSIHGLPESYGPAAYGQFFVRTSFIKVLKTIIPIVFAMVMVRFKYFRDKMFKKFSPGTGPSEQRRAQSKFEVVCIGESKTAKAKTTFSGGDPGYNETSKMFSQAAFSLLDRLKNNQARFGVLTPVEAFGLPLIDRLKSEGIVIN